MTNSEITMANAISKRYSVINRLSKNSAIVFFGSTYLSELPICELAKALGLNEYIYNRSIKKMRINDAQDYLKNCIYDLKPKKVFIEIGEEDLENVNFDMEEFFLKYEWLLYSVHNETKATIYIISTFGPHSERVNERLKKMALDSGCTFIDVSDVYESDKSEVSFMNKLKYYMRSGKMDFSDAMNLNVV